MRSPPECSYFRPVHVCELCDQPHVYETSLFRSAARSLSLVSHDGTNGEELSLPGSWALPIPPRPGSNSVLMRPSRSAVQPGKSPCTTVASFAGSDSTT